MTTTLKEWSGARSIEIEEKEGVLYVETGRSCFSFDTRIFVRALERELGVLVLRNVLEAAAAPGEGAAA